MIKSFFSRKTRGQGLVEYALILMLVGVVVIVALTALGTNVKGVLSNVNSTMAGGGGSGGPIFYNNTELSSPNQAAGISYYC